MSAVPGLHASLAMLAIVLAVGGGITATRRAVNTRRGRRAVQAALDAAGWREPYGADRLFVTELAAMHQPATIPPPLAGRHGDQHSRWRVSNLVDPTEPIDREELLAMLRDGQEVFRG